MTSPPRGIHLRYTFEAPGPARCRDREPLFDLLSALLEHGSISQVARSSGQSYRHVWGSLKHWESVLGNPLVQWTQGKHARLTPFAERLLWAERQARVRMTPHVEALRRELQRVFALADDASQDVLELAASHDLALPMLQTLAEAEPRPAPGRALRRQRGGAAQPARRPLPRRRLPRAATGAGRAGVQPRLAPACSSPARTS